MTPWSPWTSYETGPIDAVECVIALSFCETWPAEMSNVYIHASRVSSVYMMGDIPLVEVARLHHCTLYTFAT